MMDAVEDYLALRRATGFEMANAECLLSSFARFAAAREETRIRTQTAIDWAAQGPSLAQRDERLKTVRRFARHLRADDDGHELPPANHFGYRKRRRVPHIYSASEIDRLIAATDQLGPVLACTTFVIRSLFARCRPAQQVDAALANTWSPWRPIWATSIFTRRTGTSRPQPNFCETLPTPAKRSCAGESNGDADSPAHRSLPP